MLKVEASIYRMLKCCGFQPIPPTLLKLLEFLPLNFLYRYETGWVLIAYGPILPINGEWTAEL